MYVLGFMNDHMIVSHLDFSTKFEGALFSGCFSVYLVSVSYFEYELLENVYYVYYVTR